MGAKLRSGAKNQLGAKNCQEPNSGRSLDTSKPRSLELPRRESRSEYNLPCPKQPPTDRSIFHETIPKVGGLDPPSARYSPWEVIRIIAPRNSASLWPVGMSDPVLVVVLCFSPYVFLELFLVFPSCFYDVLNVSDGFSYDHIPFRPDRCQTAGNCLPHLSRQVITLRNDEKPIKPKNSKFEQTNTNQ